MLHRPESLATEAVEVTLAGSTNLVTATWEPFTNVVFAAGETNVAVRVDSAQLDAHSVSNMCFFAFINSGDTDEDGLADWMEYALGTLPFDRYSFDDAVDDLEWIDWGYGMPLSDYATVQVSVGDPSGSHSERWKLVLDVFRRMAECSR